MRTGEETEGVCVANKGGEQRNWSFGWFRCQVGELTALLASELAAVEKVVSENVTRDRGFRALSEVTHLPSPPQIEIP